MPLTGVMRKFEALADGQDVNALAAFAEIKLRRLRMESTSSVASRHIIGPAVITLIARADGACSNKAIIPLTFPLCRGGAGRNLLPGADVLRIRRQVRAKLAALNADIKEQFRNLEESVR